MKCLYLCINTCRSQPDTNIKDKHPENCQSALSAAQILQFNSSTKRQNSATGMYHSRDKETPLPVYVGLLIHGRTRKRDTFFQLGLSIFLWPGTQHINGHGDCGSCTVGLWEGWSCLSIHPEEGLFHNRCHRQYRSQSTTNTAGQSFHGTGISMFQNRTSQSDGIKREWQPEGTSESSRKYSLPEYYSTIWCYLSVL